MIKTILSYSFIVTEQHTEKSSWTSWAFRVRKKSRFR